MADAVVGAFDSNDVMAYILLKASEDNFFVNITKLQKLLYCCYGVVLAAFGWRLTAEHPAAWQYGPVFPRTFNGIKKGRIQAGKDNGFSVNCPPEALKLIDQTIRFFGKYNASQLSAWSHQSNSPWAVATKDGMVLPAPMDDFQIAQFFKNNVLKQDAGKEDRIAESV